MVQISVVNWASVWIRMKNEAPRGCGRHHCLQIIKEENREKKNFPRQELTDYWMAESQAASCELRLAPERTRLHFFTGPDFLRNTKQVKTKESN